MSSTVGHSHFEELCGLAAVGQISPSEYSELSEHLRSCDACQDAYHDLVRLTHAQLPLQAGENAVAESAPLGGFRRLLAKDYKSRFLAEAHQRGLHLADPAAAAVRLRAFSIPVLSYRAASAVAILTLFVFAGTFFQRWKGAEAQAAAATARALLASEHAATLEKQLITVARDQQTMQASLRQKQDDNAALIAPLTARVRELESKSVQDEHALQEARAELVAANDREVRAENALRDSQQKLLALNQQMEELLASQSQNDTALTVQVAELSRRVKDQEEVIEKQQKLLSVDTDVRNLMAARNLHITDVFDVDGKSGKKKAAFGRVFYTQGRSLVFYAFDLDAPKVVNAKHSFQAWGQLADGSTSAVNLGIFYVDDPAQKRWLLKFDNPEVLKQLSAVFVTAEPHGGAERPTGQKLMYAYLGHEPNHP